MIWSATEQDSDSGAVDSLQTSFLYTPSAGLGVGWEIDDPVYIDLALNVANLASSAALQTLAVATSLTWEMGL